MSHSGRNTRASALWISSARQAKIRDMPLPSCDDHHVMIKTIYSAISRGTESLVYSGSVPIGEYERMRAPFQEGDFNFPLKYGYINVGIVEQGPAPLLGERVFCLFPHQTRYVVPTSAVTVIPACVPTEQAVLCANMETAVNALWDAGPSIGERISVVGGGVVGCLIAWLAAQIPGCDVELIDINPDREAIASQLGVHFKLPTMASRERDLVFHASATEAGIQTAIGLAAIEATVVELSWYGNQSVSLPLGSAFHSQRLTLKSSQVGRLPASHQSRWNFNRRLTLAMSLLQDTTLAVLISGESHFRDLPGAYGALVSQDHKALCHRIRYDD